MQGKKFWIYRKVEIMTQIIDGKKISAEIKDELKKKVAL